MNKRNLIKISGFFNLAGGIGLLVWWILMPVFLPVGDATANFESLILDSNWLSINIIGLIATIFLTLGFPGFYLNNYEKYNKSGLIGVILATTGLILFTGIQYYETILWPAVARVKPELLQLDGVLVNGDIRVMTGLIVSGAFLGIGYILFGISALKMKAYPKIPVWFLIIGAPVFGNGISFPIRTIGLLLFCTGTVWLANILRKSSLSLTGFT